MGVIVSSNLLDETDINRQTQAIYRQGNSIIHQFRSCTDGVKLRLFISHCTNMYGPQLWSKFHNEKFGKLKVAYNNIFRHLMHIHVRDSISAKFMCYNVNAFPVVYRKLAYGFYKRLHNTDNLLLNAIVTSAFFVYKSALHMQWRKTFYM